MDRDTVRNMESYSKNKFENLVLLVGFIVGIKVHLVFACRTRVVLTLNANVALNLTIQYVDTDAINRQVRVTLTLTTHMQLKLFHYFPQKMPRRIIC